MIAEEKVITMIKVIQRQTGETLSSSLLHDANMRR